ncbi:tripartite-type tricarboxylate transporter receptor subunit TctC [Hydrogenophaga palleronii]|uniref:Tripartite-type tricarboxylate transporter receptor subunit TctC n=1 Tax=Hydrogenophaga palleronii TaxID=65655 RepID=A0ABU1WMR5_9BURK|nr:tripartite tricarboxylate transporter substrate binding protein [Hydrogenophaga palleronii]MDR7150518.1 tripartite-type tricarboxylate transporter receptor subunit TctC [Hydrogenophaga palleronii]
MKKLITTLALGVAVATSAFAWPDKPIKLVVPFPAGGTSDVLARLIGAKLSESLGQPVIVDNRPGSSGNLGADFVAKSPADGHTLVLMDVGNLVIAPSLYKLPFDVLKDFTPVAMVAYSPHLLVVSNKLPVKTMDELIAHAKTNPGKVNYAAAAGMGSATHIAGVQFAQRSGIRWNYVPYKGGSQAMNDLVGGHVDVTFNGMVATYPHVKADKIRLIAVSSASRQPEVPDAPTVSEKHPGFLTGSWQGLLAPSGTPQAAIDKLHAEVLRITALPEIQEKLVTMGAQPSKMSTVEFSNWLKAEIPAMAKIVKDEKITLE